MKSLVAAPVFLVLHMSYEALKITAGQQSLTAVAACVTADKLRSAITMTVNT